MRQLQELSSYDVEKYKNKIHLVIEDFYCFEMPMNAELFSQFKNLSFNYCATDNFVFFPTDLLQFFSGSHLVENKKSLRDFLSDSNEIEANELALGAQLINWDRNSRYCGHCGGQLLLSGKDIGKVCSSCNKSDYPRIQPVAIVLIRKGDELLLAKGPAPRKFYSCVAGFVEAGESIEQCMHREVLEEVGLKIKNLRYFGSQPWPFPHNLMLAFIAEWESGEIKIDYNELTDAAWFSKDKPPEFLPGHLSIARRMIDSIWLV